MQILQRTINYTKDGEEFFLVPYSDLHYMSANCEKQRFVSMLKKYGRQKNTFLWDNGDALDAILVGDKRFRPSCVDPDVLMGKTLREDWIDRGIDWYCKQHEKYVDPDKFLGIGSGNHMDTILKNSNGTDPTQRIADRLGTDNLGYCYFYRLNFKREGKGYQSFMIYGHHGFGGGGRTEGADVTKFCRDAMTKEGVHLFVYSHTHNMFVKHIIKVMVIGMSLHEVPMLVVNTGTFLKTYTDSPVPSYGEVAGYPPRPLGHVKIKITTPTEDYPYFRQEAIV